MSEDDLRARTAALFRDIARLLGERGAHSGDAPLAGGGGRAGAPDGAEPTGPAPRRADRGGWALLPPRRHPLLPRPHRAAATSCGRSGSGTAWCPRR